MPSELEPTVRVIPDATPEAALPVVMLTSPLVPYPAPVARTISPDWSVVASLSLSSTLEGVERVMVPVDPQRAEPLVIAMLPPLPTTSSSLDPPAVIVTDAPAALPLEPTAKEMPWALPLVDAPVAMLIEPPVPVACPVAIAILPEASTTLLVSDAAVLRVIAPVVPCAAPPEDRVTLPPVVVVPN